MSRALSPLIVNCGNHLSLLFSISLIQQCTHRHSTRRPSNPMATHEIPAWEAPPVAAKSSIFRNHFLYAPSFDKVKSFFSRKSASDIQTLDKGVPVEGVPSSRKYCGLSRRTCIILLLVSIALVALIIGLAVGLTRKSYVPNITTFIPKIPGLFWGTLLSYLLLITTVYSTNPSFSQIKSARFAATIQYRYFYR